MRSKKKLTNKQTRAHAHRLSRRHTRITQAQEKKEGKKVIHLELFDFFLFMCGSSNKYPSYSDQWMIPLTRFHGFENFDLSFS